MKLNKFFIFALALSGLFASCGKSGEAREETYVKSVEFTADATLEQKLDMASRLVPSPRQLAWQDLEMTAFLHFGVNTFTDREWGDGKESPEIFNPVELDTEQWVKTLKDAGFKMVILTAKHHDGFCLWPTATTDHSVASSPWRDGKGDVMADLRKACDKYDMKLGVYLSPWDRNAECYGDSPRYNDMFVAQLTELLTNYGKIDEVWFDGACGEGPNGKKQEYDWTRFSSVISELQPDAVMAIMGDDVRWVGNEKGVGRETEWSATALAPDIHPESDSVNAELGLFATAPDLGSRDIIAKAKKLYWWPSEVDVSIRPGWFYHDNEQPKSLAEMAQIYLTSVGRNSVLLLNVPPDRRGLIADADVARLTELRAWIDANFSDNLAGEPRGGAVAIRPEAVFNTVVLGEDLSRGQHVENFTVEAYSDGEWHPVADGTTIGRKRILSFPGMAADSMRVNVQSSRGVPYFAFIEAYNVTMPGETAAVERNFASTDAWKVVSAPGNLQKAAQAIDGNSDTFWISDESDDPKEIVVDMASVLPVAAFVYEPISGEDKAGTVFHYTLEFSKDGKEWTSAPVSGEFSNIMHNPIPQTLMFSQPIDARYFRFTALDEINGEPFITVGNLRVILK